MARIGKEKKRDENVSILFRALRDPDNTRLIPNIKRALSIAGFSDKEITYYEMTGKHMKDDLGDPTFMKEFRSDMEDFRDEMKDFGREMKRDFSTNLGTSTDTLESHVMNIRKHRNKAFFFFAAAIVCLVFGVFALIIISSDDSDVDTTSPPAITDTELAPTEEGNKL